MVSRNATVAGTHTDATTDDISESEITRLRINGNNVSTDEWGRRLRIAFESADPYQLKNLIARKVHGEAESSFASDQSESPSDSFSNSPLDLHNPHYLRQALYTLSIKENSDVAMQLELLVRFDDVEGWRESGAKHCADWMDTALGIDRRTAWERLRVGRKLRNLPVIQLLFRNGRLSWSKVRVLVGVADPNNEEKLAHAALDASVRDVQRLCDEYRWPETEDASADQHQAESQHERRRLSWQQLDDGSTQIQLILPPQKAQNFLHAIEQCEDLQYGSEGGDDGAAHTDPEPATPSQRMADAAVLVAERSLAYRGTDLSVADRYLTVMNIDSRSLTKKPYIEGIGPVPISTAREITCDCSTVAIHSDDTEPLSIGRKSRIWPPSLRLLITNRDRHCQFPGCTQHRFLHIHHIQHWADGGETSAENGVCLCNHHHSLIHSGQFTIERNLIDADCSVDPHTHKTLGLESSAKRHLLPTRCRFRVKRIKSSRYGASSYSDTTSALYAVSDDKDDNSTSIDSDNLCRDGDVPDYETIKTVQGSHSLYIESSIKLESQNGSVTNSAIHQLLADWPQEIGNQQTLNTEPSVKLALHGMILYQ